jgi:hypothetical protein
MHSMNIATAGADEAGDRWAGGQGRAHGLLRERRS